jgi:hypothetical protein
MMCCRQQYGMFSRFASVLKILGAIANNKIAVVAYLEGIIKAKTFLTSFLHSGII